MEINDFVIEQTLHGYSNGHHLLASSCDDLTDNSRKLMSILSDLSGPSLIVGFEEYITGYPLPKERLYAFSKTWYASEMKRPGCAWTHTLLINYKYLDMNLNFFSLLDLFSRPSENNLNVDKYNKPLKIRVMNSNTQCDGVSIKRLELLTWSIFSKNKPVIISASNSDEFLVEIMTLLQNYAPLFATTFTFCTGSLANRTVDRRTFDLQITPISLARNIARNNKDALVLDSVMGDHQYPKWVSELSSEIQGHSNYSFREFADTYNKKLVFDRSILNEMASLYVSSGVYNNSARIPEYFDWINKLFAKELSEIISAETIKHIFQNKNLKWFEYSNSLSTIVQLLTFEEDDINFGSQANDEIQSSVQLLLDYENSSIKELFCLVIDKNINSLGELFIKAIASKMSMQMLSYYTNMEIKACNILVNANNQLALCEDLWKESRNFQLEILSCIDGRNMECELVSKIIDVLLNTTQEVIYKQVYNSFGDLSISIVLSWYFKRPVNNVPNKKWLEIGLFSTKETLDWIFSFNNNGNCNTIYDLVLLLDSYSNDVLRYGKSPWEKLLLSTNLNKLDNSTCLSLSLFLLPILILTAGKFSNEIAFFIFKNINQSLANQKLDYDAWERMDRILPEVPWFKSWDKCKRLRMAFKEKGYLVKSF